MEPLPVQEPPQAPAPPMAGNDILPPQPVAAPTPPPVPAPAEEAPTPEASDQEQEKPTKPVTVPKQDSTPKAHDNGVTTAVIATVVIVLVLAGVALYAYLNPAS